jgi:uncharacterized protein YuzE
MFKITFDFEADALYISFKSGPAQVTTVQISADTAVDLDKDGRVQGVEILGASKYLDFTDHRPSVVLEGIEPI